MCCLGPVIRRGRVIVNCATHLLSTCIWRYVRDLIGFPPGIGASWFLVRRRAGTLFFNDCGSCLFRIGWKSFCGRWFGELFLQGISCLHGGLALLYALDVMLLLNLPNTCFGSVHQFGHCGHKFPGGCWRCLGLRLALVLGFSGYILGYRMLWWLCSSCVDSYAFGQYGAQEICLCFKERDLITWMASS